MVKRLVSSKMPIRITALTSISFVETRRLLIFDDITYAPHRVDVFLAEPLVDLGPQIADVDVHHVRIADVVVAPDRREDLVPGQHRALVAEQILQKLVNL